MATLTPTLTLASTDISASETLNLTLTDTLAVLGPVQTKRMTVDSTTADVRDNAIILAAASYTKAYVLLYNTSTATSGELITIGNQDTDDTATLDYTDMELAPGEFAFFPWNSTVTMNAVASSGTPVLEVRVFQTAA